MSNVERLETRSAQSQLSVPLEHTLLETALHEALACDEGQLQAASRRMAESLYDAAALRCRAEALWTRLVEGQP
jgi:hypothetical protein